MNIPEYLKSEQARADVARAVETREHTQAGPFPPLRHLVVMCQGAWSVVRFFCADLNGEGVDGGSMRVYFREDSNIVGRLIVTDLGEAVHALRLRTGETGISYERCQAMLHVAGDLRLGWSGEFAVEKCTAANLPAAICRVMLAAYEVSRL